MEKLAQLIPISILVISIFSFTWWQVKIEEENKENIRNKKAPKEMDIYKICTFILIAILFGLYFGF